jgi:hypothetical protein
VAEKRAEEKKKRNLEGESGANVEIHAEIDPLLEEEVDGLLKGKGIKELEELESEIN